MKSLLEISQGIGWNDRQNKPQYNSGESNVDVLTHTAVLCFVGILYIFKLGRSQGSARWAAELQIQNVFPFDFSHIETSNVKLNLCLLNTHSSSLMSLPYLLQLFVGCLAISAFTQLVVSHEESGEWDCDHDDEARIVAQFRPGVITLDGHAEDWEDVDGFEFPLRPALDPDEDKEYRAGKMAVKALHDGTDVYFMLQVDGDYVYSKGEDFKCPSVALMFQVGENATYHNMGGCEVSPDTCNSTNCRGHEVDIMHLSIGNSIPGRLYGGDSLSSESKGVRFSLVDMYSWNPHCRNIDGGGPSGNDSTALNDWKGAWWHSSFTTHSGFIEDDSPYASSGQKGTYYFELSRPLRTTDRLQQDAQFTIGLSSKFSVAFWYPSDGNPWHGSEHYTVSCDWIPMDITPGISAHIKLAAGSSWDAASGFAFLLSVVAFCISIFVGYWVSKTKSVPFTPINSL